MSTLKTSAQRAAFAQRGEAIYQRDVSPRLKPEQHGCFVVIDVDSGEFEIDANESAATQRLLARRPAARLWWKRVGHRTAHRFGPTRHADN